MGEAKIKSKLIAGIERLHDDAGGIVSGYLICRGDLTPMIIATLDEPEDSERAKRTRAIVRGINEFLTTEVEGKPRLCGTCDHKFDSKSRPPEAFFVLSPESNTPAHGLLLFGICEGCGQLGNDVVLSRMSDRLHKDIWPDGRRINLESFVKEGGHG